MRFLVDAQLPRRMAERFAAAGCDARHTLDQPAGNASTDAEICDVADEQRRIVVTKDADFVDSHLLHGRPARLLLISAGNISQGALDRLLSRLCLCCCGPSTKCMVFALPRSNKAG